MIINKLFITFSNSVYIIKINKHGTKEFLERRDGYGLQR